MTRLVVAFRNFVNSLENRKKENKKCLFHIHIIGFKSLTIFSHNFTHIPVAFIFHKFDMVLHLLLLLLLLLLLPLLLNLPTFSVAFHEYFVLEGLVSFELCALGT